VTRGAGAGKATKDGSKNPRLLDLGPATDADSPGDPAEEKLKRLSLEMRVRNDPLLKLLKEGRTKDLRKLNLASSGFRADGSALRLDLNRGKLELSSRSWKYSLPCV